MPTYFAARWHHDGDQNPVLLYEELDDQRHETRKVHEFRDGRLERTDRVALELSTTLSDVPVPTEGEIDAQPHFTVLSLSAEAFEAAWHRATAPPD